MSVEGFFNAGLLVKVWDLLEPDPERSRIQFVVETIKDLDLGIDVMASFGSDRHQGLDVVYYSVVEEGRFVRLSD